MALARGFLALVGAAYLLLAVWCAVQPVKTSQAVGFELKPGSGQSEFFVVYGGLEFALGLLFLWPLMSASATPWALKTCLLIHACLVVFRTISFTMYAGIPSMTYSLAAVEWVIFLGSAIVMWLTVSSATPA